MVEFSSQSGEDRQWSEKLGEKKIGFQAECEDLCLCQSANSCQLFYCAIERNSFENRYLIKSVSQPSASLIFRASKRKPSSARRFVRAREAWVGWLGMGNRLCAFSIKHTLASHNTLLCLLPFSSDNSLFRHKDTRSNLYHVLLLIAEHFVVHSLVMGLWI
jgi:hypothetical protein